MVIPTLKKLVDRITKILKIGTGLYSNHTIIIIDDKIFFEIDRMILALSLLVNAISDVA